VPPAPAVVKVARWQQRGDVGCSLGHLRFLALAHCRALDRARSISLLCAVAPGMRCQKGNAARLRHDQPCATAEWLNGSSINVFVSRPQGIDGLR
jgi:hypothetical protein